MKISLIAAIDKDKVIGWNNQLPWYLPEDLRRFKKITMGKPIIMGRKTFDSLGRPLPGRKNIIITRDKSFSADGCLVTNSVEDALAIADNVKEVMIIGGAEIYKLFLPIADKIYFTRIHEKSYYFGDAHFPNFNEDEWIIVKSEDHRTKSKKKNHFPYSYVELERK